MLVVLNVRKNFSFYLLISAVTGGTYKQDRTQKEQQNQNYGNDKDYGCFG